MLSTEDLERLIALKKREIETEKTLLGLAPAVAENNTNREDAVSRKSKQVQFSIDKTVSDRDDSNQGPAEGKESKPKRDLEEIPPDLERYIRKYLGLPVMLKAGEYSPNNPLIRGERTTGDALLGLGEYERRRNTLRKIRQRQYREYLDQQAKIKQEAKEKAERERREREERERLQEERERERELEREQYSPERRRASVSYAQVSGADNAYSTKVDTGVQVNNISKPLSVAVQTDNDDLFRLSPTPKNLLTQAERELSPRTVVDPKDDRPIHPASWALREQWKDIPKDQWKEPPKEWKDTPKDWKDPPKDWEEPPKNWKDPHWKETKDWKDSGTDWRDPQSQLTGTWKEQENGKTKDWNELRREMERGDWKESGRIWKDGELSERRQERRRSYGDFDERIKRSSREKASSETRTYKPSIFDADAIELRNLQAEKEAAARRQFYQQELKNQILEQQRIREERKTREKMLEQAEMRRLEQQLRSLRAAQEREIDRHHDLDCQIKDDGIEYDRKRINLQKEIDLEQQSLLRASTQPNKRIPQTSKSDTFPSKLPFYYPKVQDKMTRSQDSTIERLPYSMNIPNNSVFSPNYDVDSYLRRNLNPTRESLNSNRLDKEKYTENTPYYQPDERNVIIEKAIVHERPKVAERKIDRKVDIDRSKVDVERFTVNDNYSTVDIDYSRTDGDVKVDRPKVADRPKVTERPKITDQRRPTNLEGLNAKEDPLPIPVLRHSPKPRTNSAHEASDLSEAMRVVDDKWRVPVVQKNILKSLPNEEGKPVSILTQLGSIRRQLQLEQLKLDKMLSKDSDV